MTRIVKPRPRRASRDLLELACLARLQGGAGYKWAVRSGSAWQALCDTIYGSVNRRVVYMLHTTQLAVPDAEHRRHWHCGLIQ
jgi:hypothetical protein